MAKILVVEDMDSVVDLLRTLLQREGFDVAVAQDGLEALDAVRREKPDLMLLDLILPGLDGLEVLGHVVRGQLNKQIADDLGIHERTVKLHRTAITTKLRVQSVAELTRLSAEAGLFTTSTRTYP